MHIASPTFWQCLRLLELNASVWPKGAAQPRAVLRLTQVCEGLSRAQVRDAQDSSSSSGFDLGQWEVEVGQDYARADVISTKSVAHVASIVHHVEWIFKMLGDLARGALLLDAADVLSSPPASESDEQPTDESLSSGVSALLGLFTLEIPRRLLCQALRLSLKLLSWLDSSRNSSRHHKLAVLARKSDSAVQEEDQVGLHVIQVAHRRLLDAAARSSVDASEALQLLQSFTRETAASRESPTAAPASSSSQQPHPSWESS